MADTRRLLAAGPSRTLAAGDFHRRGSRNKERPRNVRELFAATFDAGNILDTSAEIEELASAYVAARVVSPGFTDDALHVAMATVHGVRFVVSWNFKHLVNVRREDGFNAVNLLQGWPPVRIVSPKEIIHADEGQPE